MTESVKLETWNTSTKNLDYLDFSLDWFCHDWQKRKSAYYKRIGNVNFKLEKGTYDYNSGEKYDYPILSINWGKHWQVCHSYTRNDGDCCIYYDDAGFPNYEYNALAETFWLAANMGA